MNKMHKSTVCLLLITLILLVVGGVAYFFQTAFVSPENVAMVIQQRNVDYSHAVSRCLLYPAFSKEAKELYKSLPPKRVVLDYSKRIKRDDYFYTAYGIRSVDATDGYFMDLMRKNIDDMSPLEMKQLLGWRQYSDTILKSEYPFYKEFCEKYNIEDMKQLSLFTNLWKDTPLAILSLESRLDIQTEALYDDYERGEMRLHGDDSVFIDELIELQIKDLPDYVESQNDILTKAETKKLLWWVRYTNSYVRSLLPVVRRNAARYNLMMPFDTPICRIQADYVEEKFIEKGLLK